MLILTIFTPSPRLSLKYCKYLNFMFYFHLITLKDIFIFYQVFDILWSDPQPSEGCIPNALRGAGTYFGPDVTKKFLKKNKMMYIIRSHECKLDGYELMHNNKVNIKHQTNSLTLSSTMHEMKYPPSFSILFIYCSHYQAFHSG